MIDNGLPEGVPILNVNYPSDVSCDTEKRVTRQAYMSYGKYIKPDRETISCGCKLEWKVNERIGDAGEDTDIYAIHTDRVISITPLSSMMHVETDHKYTGR